MQKAIYFYDCQKAGKLPVDHRVPWRGDSCLTDGRDVGANLAGGWFDAGDHVKFGLPMASSLTLLAWSAIDVADGVERAGQTSHLLANLRWGADYLLACRLGPTTFVAQVGDGEKDHAWWGPPEVMTLPRPSFTVTADRPGSDVVGEAAAALAACSIVFRSRDADYSKRLLATARELFDFADRHRGKYSDSIPQADKFYRSHSGYWDELTWSAAWLYRATGDEAYRKKAEVFYDRLAGGQEPGAKNFRWTHSWDDKSYGCYVLLAKLTGKQRYRADAERWLDFWTAGLKTGERIAYTPAGLAWLDGWGTLRYAANTAFFASIYAEGLPPGPRRDRYRSFAEKQIRYMLGDNPAGRSYVVGFGNNSPRNPHHRAAHGSWANDIRTPKVNRHILYGALVGGPKKDDSFNDDRSDFAASEVALDYNAGFVGALAFLVRKHGGEPLKDFPPRETPDREFFVEAESSDVGAGKLTLRAIIHNRSAWPARTTSNLSFRYHFDVDVLTKAGLTVDDFRVEWIGDKGKAAASIAKSGSSQTPRYLEIAFPDDPIRPAGANESKREVRFRLIATKNASAWNPRADPSFFGSERGSLTIAERMTVHSNGHHVGGKAPGQ